MFDFYKNGKKINNIAEILDCYFMPIKVFIDKGYSVKVRKEKWDLR